MPENAEKFICELCAFKCSKNSNWITHLSTAKHKNRTEIEQLKQHLDKNNAESLAYKCSECFKEYKSRSALWYHKKNSKCLKNNNKDEDKNNSNCSKNNDKDEDKNNSNCLKNNDKDEDKKNENNIQSKLLTEIIKQNYELQKQLFELANKPNIINNYNNNTTNTNTTNNQFNLNMFLNEQCKNAINMEDFLDSIQLTVSDFEETGKLGFVSGISRIFIENIKKMDIHERPLHCTDLKRETVYIKENNKWEKEDTNKTKLNNVVKRIVKKNICQLPNWKKENPNYLKSNTKDNDDYIRISLNSLGSEYDDEQKRMDDKIIRNMLKEVVLEK